MVPKIFLSDLCSHRSLVWIELQRNFEFFVLSILNGDHRIIGKEEHHIKKHQSIRSFISKQRQAKTNHDYTSTNNHFIKPIQLKKVPLFVLCFLVLINWVSLFSVEVDLDDITHLWRWKWIRRLEVIIYLVCFVFLN